MRAPNYCFALGTCALLVACGASQNVVEQAVPVLAARAEPPAAPAHGNETLFAALELGEWGWDEGNTCETNPHAISFSEDRRVMRLTYRGPAAPENGFPDEVAVYEIEFVGEDYVRGRIRGEHRRTEDGKLVVWDLRLIADGEYCWRRTDWDGGCTESIRRCPALPARENQ